MSRPFGVVAERAFGAVRVTLGLIVVSFLAVCFLTLQLGCNGVLSTGSSIGDTSASTSDPSRPAPISLTDWYAKDPDAFKTPEQPLVIDAGIVFAGQPTYLCYPIEKFGITNADDIIDITTSCECVTVEKVKYEDMGGEIRGALRFEFRADHDSNKFDLVIETICKTSNDTDKRICARLLAR